MTETEVVTVFESSDPGLIAIVRSILDDASIPYVAKGEGLQDLIGGGRIGALNLVTGPVQFEVRVSDAATARELLHEFSSGAGGAR